MSMKKKIIGIEEMYKNSQISKTIIQRYKKAIVLGDSVVESILDYHLLSKHQVVARRNKSIDQIFGDLLLTVAYEPTNVFMMYGKRDLANFEGNVSSFIHHYKDSINYLRYEIPEVQIFVNSILPSRKDVMSFYGGFHKLDKFNLELKQMCKEMKIKYIDNSKLVDWTEDMFEYDGHYPSYSFYVKWLEYMADLAGL